MKFTRSLVPESLGDGWHFYLIHISGVVCLSLSVISCCIVIAATLFKHPRANSIKLFFKLPIRKRLVFFLAVLSLGYCVSHLIDHGYMLRTRRQTPDKPCTAIGFSVLLFAVAYHLMNAFIALNAFSMAVRQRKVGTGRYDWRLLAICFGSGFVFVSVLLATRHLGPGGAWCLIDQRKEYGALIGHVIGVMLIVTFTLIVVCYCAIWIILKKTWAGLRHRHGRSVRAMMLSIALYLLQMWSYVVYSCWMFVQSPPIVIIWFVVTLPNLCGVCSLVVYIRMNYAKWKKVQNVPTTKKEDLSPPLGDQVKGTVERDAGDMQLESIESHTPKEASA